ncbi:MAG: hypothetical protein L3J76_05100, partial [Candidatus Hydrothermae bacterium]|nr:hypothetical protein [Candidatus Hydrothermae bacterium]
MEGVPSCGVQTGQLPGRPADDPDHPLSFQVRGVGAQRIQKMLETPAGIRSLEPVRQGIQGGFHIVEAGKRQGPIGEVQAIQIPPKQGELGGGQQNPVGMKLEYAFPVRTRETSHSGEVLHSGKGIMSGHPHQGIPSPQPEHQFCQVRGETDHPHGQQHQEPSRVHDECSSM